MLVEVLYHFLLGLVAVIIGAVPLGLVNLSVVNTALKEGRREAFSLSLGATIVEVFFVVVALFAGARLADYLDGNLWVELAVLLVLLLASLTFFFKKNGRKNGSQISIDPLLKGMLLNLISVQVLIYWLVAIAFLQTNIGIVFTAECIAAFCLAVILGKIGVLLTYRYSAVKIAAHSSLISKKINLLLGIILLIVALIQGGKMFFF